MLFPAFLLYTFIKVDCPYVFCSIVYSIHSLPLAAVSIQWGEITAMLQHHGPGFRWIICPWSLTGCKLPGNNKKHFFIYLKYSYSASRMLIPTVKTNIIKKSNCGKLKYIELNNILRKQTWKVFTWLERQWRLVAVFSTCSHRRRCPTRWLTRYLSADLGLSWRSSARLHLRLVSFTSIRDKICFKSPNRQKHY